MTLRTFCLIAAISLAIPQVSLGQDRHEIFTTLSDMDVPYRIPAIAALQDGSLICVADYRWSGADIGLVKDGRIDLMMRISR
ncbi:MAG: exo-alpha-sialidase, partial [Bacteroidales bacterium]|nr:exo-alpha-sialidase [Bacteroidales bacterium]